MRDIYLAGMPFIACVLLLIGMMIIFRRSQPGCPASAVRRNRLPSNVGMRSGTELAGKVALVTGGAQHRPRHRARAPAGGAGVMVNARTSRAEAEKTVE